MNGCILQGETDGSSIHDKIILKIVANKRKNQGNQLENKPHVEQHTSAITERTIIRVEPYLSERKPQTLLQMTSVIL